jgi:putative phosphoesterase
VRVGLISDTHNQLRPEVFAAFEGVDLILHAGDVGHPPIITELETIAPVRAVHGNTDGFDIRGLYGEELKLELEGKQIVVVHGHLLGSPTPEKLRLMYKQADLVVYGHTHRQLLDATAAPVVVNPGAAGAARFELRPSVALLELPELSVRFIDLA